MNIFIMRHGEAEIIAESDMARNLTEKGKLQSSIQAEWLKRTGIDIQKVIVSPYIRAQQTFDEINNVFENNLISKKESWNAITPDGDSRIVVDYLSVLENEEIENVLLVSHLPLVDEILIRLLNQTKILNFYPSTIVHIEWCTGQKGVMKKFNQ